MGRDSKLLIAEQVVKNPPAPMTAVVDLAVMMFGGKERTLSGFQEIVGAAGLQIREVFHDPSVMDSIIECVKV